MTIEVYCFQRNGSEPVAGAVIALADGGGTLARRRTDCRGRCAFTGLTSGAYTVRQLSAPAYLIASPAIHTVTLRPCSERAAAGFADTFRYAQTTDTRLDKKIQSQINERRVQGERHPGYSPLF
jgi:hypothetical protein